MVEIKELDNKYIVVKWEDGFKHTSLTFRYCVVKAILPIKPISLYVPIGN